ncbi:MAG: response regulator [Reichenbachiella sp.]|uniref:response regulator n=1 Tax=Reichenbachiella sp. TaxID=2184521 RepID=UPI003266126B
MKSRISEIMVIDNNELDIMLCESVIESIDPELNIIYSNNAIAAIKLLKAPGGKLPNIILVDIEMPEMNGWEFYNSVKDLIRSQKRPVMVCILSSSEKQADIETFNNQEIPFFIKKPLTEQLYLKLKNNYTQYFSKLDWNREIRTSA